jgi:mono/diheme cytochrome c family protein
LVPGSDTFLKQVQATPPPAPETEKAKAGTDKKPMPAEQPPAPPKKPEETKPKSETPPAPAVKPAPEKAKSEEAMTAAEPKKEVPEAGKPKADPAAIAAAMTLGKAKFMICGACHGPDGKGLPLGPGMLMAPGYAESLIVKRESAEMFALVVLKGIAKEDAKYLGIMAPLEASLNDQDIAAVATYVRNEFGGHKDLVTPDQVAAWRAKYKNITTSVKRGELEKIVSKTE